MVVKYWAGCDPYPSVSEITDVAVCDGGMVMELAKEGFMNIHVKNITDVEYSNVTNELLHTHSADITRLRDRTFYADNS